MWTQEPEATYGSFVLPGLEDMSFQVPDASNERGRVLLLRASGFRRRACRPVNEPLRARFNMRGVQSWPLTGELVRGRMFCLDKPKMRLDDLMLGEVVAWLAVTRLESFYWQDRLARGGGARRARPAGARSARQPAAVAGRRRASAGCGPAAARSRPGGRQAASGRRAGAARARRARDALVRHPAASGARAGGVSGRHEPCAAAGGAPPADRAAVGHPCETAHRFHDGADRGDARRDLSSRPGKHRQRGASRRRVGDRRAADPTRRRYRAANCRRWPRVRVPGHV